MTDSTSKRRPNRTLVVFGILAIIFLLTLVTILVLHTGDEAILPMESSDLPAAVCVHVVSAIADMRLTGCSAGVWAAAA